MWIELSIKTLLGATKPHNYFVVFGRKNSKIICYIVFLSLFTKIQIKLHPILKKKSLISLRNKLH